MIAFASLVKQIVTGHTGHLWLKIETAIGQTLQLFKYLLRDYFNKNCSFSKSSQESYVTE